MTNKAEQQKERKPRQIPVLSFENWLQTSVGRKCLSTKGLTKEYMKNRLWWAFHAGNTSRQVWMTSEIQGILEQIASSKGNYISNGVKRRIQYVLNNKEDYSLQNLNK